MTRVLIANYFFPRGGSAHATRAQVRELRRQGVEVTLVTGSRSDRGDDTDAREFYVGLDPVAVDFAPALRTPQPLRFHGGAGTAPIHGSFEDRPGAADAVLASVQAATCSSSSSSCRSRPGRWRLGRSTATPSTSSTSTT